MGYNKLETIKDVLCRRDNMTEIEAEDLIEEARTQLKYYLDDINFESAGDICAEFFGLEPDYITDLF